MQRRSARAARVAYKDESDASEWEENDESSDYDPSDVVSEDWEVDSKEQALMVKHEPQGSFDAPALPVKKHARSHSGSDTDSDVPLADRVRARRKAPKPTLTRVCMRH